MEPFGLLKILANASWFHFLCILISVNSETSGISLSLNGMTIPNHGLVYIDHIGETDQNSLQCETTLEACCENEDLGHWKYPHYGLVRSKNETDEDVFFSSRGRKKVMLHRKNVPIKMVGVMRCEVPDTQTFPENSVIHVAIYNINKGVPEIYKMQVDRIIMSINCFTRDGPITEYSWFKDGTVIPMQSGSPYSHSRTIINFGTADYLISLRATNERDLIGSFKCMVNNSAGIHERTVVLGSDFSMSFVRGCGALSHLENGTIELSNGFRVGSRVTITCRESYRLSHLQTAKCYDAGWYSLPSCVFERDCTNGFEANNGLLVQYTDRFNEFSVASFSCEESYRMIGTGNPVSCRDGVWDGSSPQCELVVCPEIIITSNLILDVTNNSRVGAKAIYSCMAPYTLYPPNENTRVCLSAGQWSGGNKRCLLSQYAAASEVCGPVDTDGIVQARYTRNQAILTCSKGYYLLGTKIRTCDLDTRKWSQKSFRCEKESAGVIVHLDGYLLLCTILYSLFLIPFTN